MSVRLRETVKKIKRNLSLRSSREDVRAGEHTWASSQDIKWNHHSGKLSSPASSGSVTSAAVGVSSGLSEKTVVIYEAQSLAEALAASKGRPSSAATAATATSCTDSRPPDGQRSEATMEAAEDLQPQQQEARTVELVRATGSGSFGFVAGGQKPVTVRQIDEGGASEGFLFPGDQIVGINGVDTTDLAQSRVLELIRNTGDVIKLTVQQPAQTGGTRSILRSGSDEAKKLKKSSSRVRFSEAVEEAEGDGHIATTQHDACRPWSEATVPILKVYLENHQTRSFQFDGCVIAEDVIQLLLQKLEISAVEHFALVVGELGCTDISRFRALPPDEMIAETLSTETRCSLRILYAPKDPYDLLRNDPVAFDYLYKQCCNDLIDERLVPNQGSNAVALRLASLYMLEHALVHDIQPHKVNAKKVEKEFGLRSFLAPGLVSSMQPKMLHRKLDSFLKLNRGLAAPGQKCVTALQARMHYLQIAAGLPTFCARRFAARSYEGHRPVDVLLLVGPNCGISRIGDVLTDSFRKIMSLEEVAELNLNDQPDEEYEGLLLKIVELRSTRNPEFVRLLMKEAAAYDFCTYVARYKALLTGKAAANSMLHQQRSKGKDNGPISSDERSTVSSDENQDIIVPPVDYDEAATDSDGEGDRNAHAVNSILSAAFDDLDDGLLDADASCGGNQSTCLTKEGVRAGESQSDPPRMLQTPEVRSDRLQFMETKSDSFAAAIRVSAEVAHDEEIGMQMSAIDAAISRDHCAQGEDESGIDSDSEDSGNETLNSVDTSSSCMTGDSQQSQGLSWSSELGKSLPDHCESHAPASYVAKNCAPAKGKVAQPHHSDSKASCRFEPASVQVAVPFTDGIMMAACAEADDVSTEDDDEDVTSIADRAAIPHTISEKFGFNITSDSDSMLLTPDKPERQKQTPTANTRYQTTSSPTLADPVAGQSPAEQRSLRRRPFSDGFTLGNLPALTGLDPGVAKNQEAGKKQNKLRRQEAVLSGTLPEAPLPSEANSVTLRGGRARAHDVRRATVASSSKLAQAFAKLSSSTSSGSHDFCPATPPRQRSISAPFNVCSTAQGVLARSKPVRAPLLLGSPRSPMSPDAGLPSPIFRMPRPSCPPPPPPPQPSSVAADSPTHRYLSGAEEGATQWHSHDCVGSSNGHASSPLPSATWQRYRAESTMTITGQVAGNMPSSLASKNVLILSQSVDNFQRSTSESQRSPRDTAVNGRLSVRSSSSSLQLPTDDAESVSYSFDRELGVQDTRRTVLSESSAGSSKSRVLARLIDALRPRKKSASLSRAASAIELVPRVDNKKLSLPRSISGTHRQRPSIFTRTKEVTLLRATSLGGCGDGAEICSPEDAWPSKFGPLPAAEVCTIDTTASAPKEVWLRTCDLETFRMPSPSIDKELLGARTDFGVSQRSFSPRHHPRLLDDVDFSTAASGYEAAGNAAPPPSSPQEPLDADDGLLFSKCRQMSCESTNSEQQVFYDDIPGAVATSPTAELARVHVEDVADKAVEAAHWGSVSDTITIIKDSESGLQDAADMPSDAQQTTFACSSSVSQLIAMSVDSESLDTESDDEEAPPSPPASQTSHIVFSDAIAATSRVTSLTEALAEIGDPGDASGACTAVERLLDCLSRFEDARCAGEQYAPTADNPEKAAAAIKRLSSEAQLMVVECKQMVAAIARRQRHEAAASGAGDSGGGADAAGAAASALREEERRLVARSFGTFTRLLGSAASDAPTTLCDAGAGATTNQPAQLRGCLLTLGRAYAAALTAAADCADPSGGRASPADDPASGAAGAATTDGLAASGRGARGSGTPSAAKPGADELVRRLMAVATELATALGGLIRLLKAMRGSDTAR